ncbi:unannotated protein [freshwater metagenome]|uniref:Unannotated protein n=1 Tax=freshwater metagenome TaxID=449393 RepID=A0A6J7XWP2_9ZZZZ|nr:septum formation initiator family protein [Actinomycetota bacterium]
MARRRLNFSRRRSNSRAFALAGILFVLAITIAPPIKHYITQRAQINALQNQYETTNAALAQARRDLQLWRDPEYVASQARSRLHFVLPGERQYIISDPTAPQEKISTSVPEKDLPVGQPWYLRLIASITEIQTK